MASSDICGEENGSVIEPPMMKSDPKHPKRGNFFLKYPLIPFISNHPNGGGDKTITSVSFIALDIRNPPITLERRNR